MIHILTIIFNLFYNIGSDNYEIISKKEITNSLREKVPQESTTTAGHKRNNLKKQIMKLQYEEESEDKKVYVDSLYLYNNNDEYIK